MTLLFICLGGALGTGARYLASELAAKQFGAALPFGTLVVNVLGSFLIGVLMQVALKTDLMHPTFRVVLTIGFLGGFTTYSTFNHETLAYFQEGEMFKAFLNSFVMLFACLVAGFAGTSIAKWFITIAP